MDNKELTFKLQRVASGIALLNGLQIEPDRFIVKFKEANGVQTIQLLLDILIQEEELYGHPADWWQMFKERYFPKWAKRRWPIKQTEVWAMHKYPELEPPNDIIGKEFVHLRIVGERRRTFSREELL